MDNWRLARSHLNMYPRFVGWLGSQMERRLGGVFTGRIREMSAVFVLALLPIKLSCFLFTGAVCSVLAPSLGYSVYTNSACSRDARFGPCLAPLWNLFRPVYLLTHRGALTQAEKGSDKDELNFGTWYLWTLPVYSDPVIAPQARSKVVVPNTSRKKENQSVSQL